MSVMAGRRSARLLSALVTAGVASGWPPASGSSQSPSAWKCPTDLLPVRIRLLRARHGWRQSEVADRLGISQQAYAKLERPGANPELNTLVRVERAPEAPLLEYA
jgi:DNA-binding XRE family transcriptional regulator